LYPTLWEQIQIAASFGHSIWDLKIHWSLLAAVYCS